MKININLYNAKTDNDFIGFIIDENKYSICFPIGYHLKSDVYNEDTEEDVEILTDIIDMANMNDYDASKSYDFSFKYARKVINDFKDYGLYKETNKYDDNNPSGKILWKNVTDDKLNQLTFLKKKKIINVYYEKTNYNYLDKIHLIQRYCLGIISKVIGPIYKFYYPNMEKPYSDGDMIHILDREISNINESNKIEILKNMKYFIEHTKCLDLNENTKYEYGTYHFFPLWEKLINNVFNGNENVSDYYPKAYFLNLNFNWLKDTVPSREDTVIDDEESNTLIILDSKYYQLGSFPNEYDINKQMRYAEYCKKLKENKSDLKIYNIFILPQDLSKNENYFKIERFASNVKKIDNIEQLVNNGIIMPICYLDTKTVIMNKNLDINKIIDSINCIVENNKKLL